MSATACSARGLQPAAPNCDEHGAAYEPALPLSIAALDFLQTDAPWVSPGFPGAYGAHLSE